MPSTTQSPPSATGLGFLPSYPSPVMLPSLTSGAAPAGPRGTWPASRFDLAISAFGAGAGAAFAFMKTFGMTRGLTEELDADGKARALDALRLIRASASSR